MNDQTIGYASLFAAGLPAPKAPEGAAPTYNFGSGHNDPAVIPVDELAEVAARVIREEGRSLAIYHLGGSALGHEKLREVIAGKLQRHRGISCSVNEVLITSGSLQGIDLVNTLMLDSGDTVLVEQFSYSAAISKLAALGVEAVAAPLDSGGINMDDLARQLDSLRAQGKRPKYLYTIPTVQNPTGSVLSLERRHRLIEISRRYDLLVFEDECYADIVWAGRAPPSLYALAPDRVIHIGSLSKTLAPALRVGYLLARWPAMGQILALKTDGGTGALDQMVAASFFRDSFDSHVTTLTAHMKSKLDVLLEAIEREFGSAVEVQAPQGGLFVWLTFPPGVDVRRLVGPAAAAGVAFNPGPDWAVSPADGHNHVRLCFGLVTPDEIKEGIAEFARVCFETVGLPERSANRLNRRSA